MNAEYLLDAIGQLDDDLLKEVECYRRPKARYSALLGLAASFAVVLLLGYGATHFGMGGGAPGGGNGAASVRGGNIAQGGHSETDAPSSTEDDGLGGAFDPNAAHEDVPFSPGAGWFTDTGTANAETPVKSGDNSDTTIELNGALFTISLRGDTSADRDTFQLHSSGGRILDELPEGCVPLGRLEHPEGAQEVDGPSTDAEEYVGCPVWLLMEDPETTVLYVELPEGGYLEFR